jgi:hypothetical protein
MRGTAPQWGTIRRWIATTIAILALAMTVTGLVTMPDRAHGGSSPRPAKATDDVPTPVVVQLAADDLRLPPRWKHDPEFSEPGAPTFSAGELTLQFAALDVAVPGDELDRDFGAGMVDAMRQKFPGYRLGGVTPVELTPELQSLEHRFTYEVDGVRMFAYQYVSYDSAQERLWYASVYSAASVREPALQRVRDNIVAGLAI